MITSIQLGNIFSSGDRTVVGGGSTGFDIESLVEGLTTARRLPAVQLEETLEENASRRTAFTEFSTLISNFQDSAALLRNPPGVDNASENIFEFRNAALTSNDGVAASTYLSATAAPGAVLSDYDISIESVATFSVKTTETFQLADTNEVAVGVGLPFNAGTLTLGANDVDIELEAGDTLEQVLTKINAVSGESGVRATTIKVSDGNFRIQFKTTETGAENNYSILGEHEQVGNEIVIEAEDFIENISRSGDTFSGGASVDAAGGFFISAQPSNSDNYSVNIETTAPETIYNIDFAEAGRYYIHVRGQGGSANNSLHVGLNGSVPDSSNGITGFGAGVFTYENVSQQTGEAAFIDVESPGVQTISVYAREDGTAIDQIVFSSDAAYTPSAVETSTQVEKNVGIFNIGFAIEENATDAKLTIDGTTIIRSTNNIDDLVEDVTFSLNQDTPIGSEVTVSVEPDTEIARSAILNFVDTYNELRVFFARQTEVGEDGFPTESAVLRQSPTLRSLVDNVINELSSVVNGLAVEPNRLADLGIEFDDFSGDEDTPFTRNILVLDTDKLDNALLGDFESVRNIFEFDFVSDNSEIQIFNRTNASSVTSFELNLDITNGIYEATHAGGTDAVDVSAIPGGGFLVTGQQGTALEGLELIYGGSTDATASINISQGVGDRIYNALESALDEEEGAIAAELDSLIASDQRLEADIIRIDEAVERFREQQLTRFANLESLISSTNTILQSLDAQANAANN